NTLYEEPMGNLSNGAGDHFFVGRTAGMEIRRGLIAFKDLSAIPNGAIVSSVKLHLNLSREDSVATTVNLVPVTSNWGEGASHAGGNEGAGANPAAGDATWLHTMYDTDFWNTSGGDFIEIPSASLLVDDEGSYTFGSSSEMVANVQDWKDGLMPNFGWILIADEDATTSKRFDSRNNSDSAFQPVLEVEFSATGSSFDFSGIWYDPSLDGEGYNVYKTPFGWLIYFFGYTADGQILWVTSDLVQLDQLLFGQPIEFPMLVGVPGTFADPSPSSELIVYGTLTVIFNSCTTGFFTLDGLDGIKASQVVKLVGVEGTNCLEVR
ncbi:MAG TPA: DNRLRE domain-containing protein, partial [Xanthomonadales bacterium]|nr:DNRLRE domain-containing protein [Xanthomonadales bacterium]